MEAECLNPQVILESLVPHVHLAVVSKRGIAHPIPRVCQCNWTAKLRSHGGQAQLMPWYEALKWARALSGKPSVEKQVQVPQKLRNCAFPLPLPEVSALCSSQGWTDSPCCIQFCRADLLSFQYIHNFPPCCKSSDKYFLIFKRKNSWHCPLWKCWPIKSKQGMLNIN